MSELIKIYEIKVIMIIKIYIFEVSDYFNKIKTRICIYIYIYIYIYLFIYLYT